MSNKNINNNFDSGYLAGIAFTLIACVSVCVSLIFSLVISLMAVTTKTPIETLASNDFIILLSFLFGSLSCVITIFIINYKFKTNQKQLLIPNKNVNNLVVYIATLLITFGVMFGLSELNGYFIEFLKSLGVSPPEPSLPTNNVIMVILTIIFVCLTPALFEETLFRGIITFSLKNYGEVFAIIISGVLFSLFHMQPSQTLYQFVFGCLFAFISLRAKSVLPVILSHFLNNLFVVLNYYYFNINFEGTAKIIVTVIALISLAVGVTLIALFTKKEDLSNIEKPNKMPFIKMSLIGFGVCLAMWLTNLV